MKYGSYKQETTSTYIILLQCILLLLSTRYIKYWVSLDNRQWRKYFCPKPMRSWRNSSPLLQRERYTCRTTTSYFTLLRSIVSNASCLRRSRRSLLDSDHEATPPEPVLPPALFWKSILNWQIHRNYKRNMKYGDEEETRTWRKTRN